MSDFLTCLSSSWCSKSKISAMDEPSFASKEWYVWMERLPVSLKVPELTATRVLEGGDWKDAGMRELASVVRAIVRVRRFSLLLLLSVWSTMLCEICCWVPLQNDGCIRADVNEAYHRFVSKTQHAWDMPDCNCLETAGMSREVQ